MKVQYLLFALTTYFLCSCTEEIDFSQKPGEIPNIIENISFVPLPGKVELTINTPQIDDYIYTKIDFTVREGVNKSVKISKYESKVVLEGFAKEGVHSVTLTPFSRGDVAGPSKIFDVEVAKPGYIQALESLDPYFSFGMMGVRFTNPMEDNLTIYLATYHEDVKEILTDQNKQVSAAEGKVNFLDLPMKDQKYYLYIADRFGNKSDSVVIEGSPLYEEQLSKSGYRNFALQAGSLAYYTSETSFGVANLWDDLVGNVNNGTAFLSYQAINTNANQHLNFAIDFGKQATVSRFKLVHAGNDNYWYKASHAFATLTPKIFEVWGSNSPVASSLLFDGWEKISDFESKRPEGLSTIEGNSLVTTTGEDFLIDEPKGPYRYYRFVIKQTWSNATYAMIDELTFFGSY
ncbi:DUF5000 domain-containing lipoprotein [Sphingobacterium bovistauri]|uniref:DUF4959 domain-containing protein n=1 Tax=Sphingobacterium bovistauri TaxID=2781959 RepID=A0ABS7Z6Y5_9SPHI|nr:DUF5000 domain-containing lipoprotein [Sphingobacterium bovistauri]MCA5005186.1 DUF4959 domain-containing protein [Sphingobacterium bovistauri]